MNVLVVLKKEDKEEFLDRVMDGMDCRVMTARLVMALSHSSARDRMSWVPDVVVACGEDAAAAAREFCGNKIGLVTIPSLPTDAVVGVLRDLLSREEVTMGHFDVKLRGRGVVTVEELSLTGEALLV